MMGLVQMVSRQILRQPVFKGLERRVRVFPGVGKVLVAPLNSS